MSDHWNSLADLLGTPSIDPPQKKAALPKKADVETTRTPSEPSFQPPNDERTSATSRSEVGDTVSPPAPPPAKPEQPSRLRSSWDTVARLFGVSSSAELAPPPSDDSSASLKIEKEIVSDPEDDLFAGFGRKQDRIQDEAPPRKQPERPVADREAAGRPKKKPSSFWDTPKSEIDEPLVPPSSVPSAHRAIEPVARFEAEDSGEVPERRGRSRNIRRGRNSEGVPEAPRHVADVPEADLSRDRGRSDVRNEPVARRSERNEKPSEGNRSGRGERSERSASRPTQDRTSSSDRAPSSERAASGERPPTADRPPREGERRPRNDGRVARTSDRSERPQKRTTESDVSQPVRSGERAARSERPTREGETQDRPSRGRGPRREPQPVEDDGDWDSREVGFDDEPDEIVSERVLPTASVEDDDSAVAPTRGRRRRRRSGPRPGSESTEPTSADEAAGRQAYGRSAVSDDDANDDHEEVENLRIHKVTSWLDAISPMIDSNMENHKRNPGGDRNRGGSGSRRRNSNSGGSGNR